MKRSALTLAAFAAASVAFVAGESAQAACGKFRAVIKDVKVTRAAGGAPVAAAAGSEVCAGDAIAAGADSRASVEMEDKNVLNLSPNTKIVIEAYEKKKVMLNVLGGKMRSSIASGNKYDDKNTFQVKTKSAVAGVRGTDFLTGYSPSTGKTEVVTFSGRVDVGTAGPGGTIANAVSVGPGQKTEATAGQAPAAPRAVPAAELKQLNQTTAAAPQAPSPNAAPAADQGGKKDGDRDAAKTDAKSADGGAKTSDSGSSAKNDRAPASMPGPGAGASSGRSMVSVGDASGATQPAAMPTIAAQPAPPAIPTAPTVAVPTLPPVVPAVDPNIANVIQRSGPSNVHINVNYNK